MGPLTLDHSIHHWINDGVMALLFFVVGLEIEHKVLVGELSDPKQAVLLVIAAFGGMAAPAAIYALLNLGGPGAAGSGVLMATDIAFAVGVMALLGKRVPVSPLTLLGAGHRWPQTSGSPLAVGCACTG